MKVERYLLLGVFIAVQFSCKEKTPALYSELSFEEKNEVLDSLNTQFDSDNVYKMIPDLIKSINGNIKTVVLNRSNLDSNYFDIKNGMVYHEINDNLNLPAISEFYAPSRASQIISLRPEYKQRFCSNLPSIEAVSDKILSFIILAASKRKAKLFCQRLPHKFPRMVETNIFMNSGTEKWKIKVSLFVPEESKKCYEMFYNSIELVSENSKSSICKREKLALAKAGFMALLISEACIGFENYAAEASLNYEDMFNNLRIK